MMRRTLVFGLLFFCTVTAAAWAADRARDLAREQLDFGVAVAQKGLWREALYRWEKAVEIDPKYAAAYNNLAIGYEHEGQLDKAKAAYEKAMALEPKNLQIKQNYDFFKEIHDRAQARTAK